MTIYVLILIVFLIVSIVNILTMPSMHRKSNANDHVSVLIPMRNEEKNAEAVIQSVLHSSHQNLDIVVLNDHSTDGTGDILKKFQDNITVIEGSELPDSWVGKVYACHQLSKQAKGEYLLFIDADVRVAPEAISQALWLQKKYDAGLVTGFPRFPVRPLLGKLLVPLQHFFIFFHLPNLIANSTLKPAFTAAHGAFMFFERGAYFSSGGHSAVSGSLVEDVHLTRVLKKKGYRCILANVTNSVTCKMYDANKDVWEGFLKNVFNGIGKSKAGAAGVMLFYFAFYFLPLPFAIYGLTGDYIWIIPLLVVWAQTFLIDIATKQSPFHFILMPFSALALIALLSASMMKSILNKGYTWKGRVYKS
ncbi:glycosyltransferase [Jeotgalibacillus aurantiacus]|uniref:glycosyltransferase n=1 Tax=Jeotgalibacillus aurantiacus TaxID=2763266 RepID=UPI001D09F4FD|nr:glycosyltransferase family 2 protein [Jeotgalibacillus aurantiacus]